MTIVYAVVSRGKTVLAEYTFTSGNFPTITRVLLGKIDASVDTRMSYVYDQYVFHYIGCDGVLFLCMCDDPQATSKRRLPFAFLEDIRQRFHATYGEQAHTAIAFAMNEDFGRVLQRQMDFYNGPSADQFAQVSRKLDDVKGVMVQNIELVLDRGEKLELLVDKSERLQTSAFTFERSSRKLRDAMFWKKVKAYLLMGGVMAVLAYIISVMACGFDYAQCRDDDDSKQRRLLSGLRLLLR